ncbi:hypothetical protein BKA65DRAFT_584620 [Rhexocercosporidium sp. MPI-PUGE-AT-0058]|nr:hypothetical protein BKA65DRAFT_584620 [Rhexocercosporidium sp. MPI-PUGE-AT-0058]
MQAPSPSPSPSSPASLPASSSARGIPDHVAHLGSSDAGPSLSEKLAGEIYSHKHSAWAVHHGTTILKRDELESHASFSPSLAYSPELHLYHSLPALEYTVVHSEHRRAHDRVPQASDGVLVAQTESPKQWISSDIPVEKGSQNMVDHQDISISSAVDFQMTPNIFPANVPTFNDASMALGYFNAGDGTNMYLNTPWINYPQVVNNDLPIMTNYSPWSTETHHLNLGLPMLPAIQAPRAPTFCTLCPASFTRPSDFQRHHESVRLGIKHHCFWPRCSNNRGNGYCRAEKLRTHQRKVHGLA